MRSGASCGFVVAPSPTMAAALRSTREAIPSSHDAASPGLPCCRITRAPDSSSEQARFQCPARSHTSAASSRPLASAEGSSAWHWSPRARATLGSPPILPL